MPHPPRRILLATDLSARCDRALDRAAALASAWKAEIVAVHALEQSGDVFTQEVERRLPSWRRAPDPVRLVEEQLRHDMLQTGVDIQAVVEKGEAPDVVLRHAEAQACELIVIGIARDETLGRFGLGTTVDRLLRRTRIPLLIVKQRPRGPYRDMLVATDFSESSRHALRTAVALFPDTRCSLFHAFDPPAIRLGAAAENEEQHRTAALKDCAEFLADARLPDDRRAGCAILAEHGRPNVLIRQYVRDNGVDLVVLGAQGRSALFNVFIGSTAKEVLSSLPCDALVVREPHAPVERS